MLALSVLLPVAHAQFALSVLTATTETPVASRYDFGTVSPGDVVTANFRLRNTASGPATITLLSVAGAGFTLSSKPALPLTLSAQGSAVFTVTFQASTTGGYSAPLSSDGISVLLTAAVVPVSPPRLTISLPSAQSAQQGAVSVNFHTPAAASGSGTVTLQFLPTSAGASDPAIAFASGGRSAPFTFAAGDIQATFDTGRTAAFQTGTTAGSIVFLAQAGSMSDQQSVLVDPAPVAFGSAQASRSPGAIEVQVAGFDNTRTAGRLSFSFYDNGGNPISPGAIAADATAAFAQYYSSSSLGGNFLLRAVFPVMGDTVGITYFQAVFTNAAGSSTTARTALQ